MTNSLAATLTSLAPYSVPEATPYPRRWFPLGAYKPTPWWCWPLLPVLLPAGFVLMILLFGWRKK